MLSVGEALELKSLFHRYALAELDGREADCWWLMWEFEERVDSLTEGYPEAMPQEQK